MTISTDSIYERFWAEQSGLRGEPAHGWRYHTERLLTPDGWELPVYRLRPTRPIGGAPVVLIPGHGTTAWTFFGGSRGGIGGALATAGRDVWALDLRGARGSTQRGREAGSVSIEGKVSVDVPAFVHHVQRRTGQVMVDAVGHSLGGVFLYLHGLLADSPLRRMVTIASPLAVPKSAIPAPLRSWPMQVLARGLGRVPIGGLADKLVSRAQTSWMPIHFDPDHVDAAGFRAFLRWGVTDVFGDELADLLKWIAAADHHALWPARAAEINGHRLETAVRFMVGAEDRLTPPDAVKVAFQRIGGAESDYMVLGKATGCRQDYRHTDILLGQRVHEEVAPHVVDWLSRA